ncbi:uncharacterized protein [Nicotiana tomentosiformis]|uniref:uncharacterized protein n=1 Tax=Nicotiana tomentosiformis TaxID=4098 RepID=UPI00388C389B
MCMPKNSSRIGELYEALPDPEKAFEALNRENKKDKRQQNSTERIELDMGDVNDNQNNRNIANEPNNQGVARLVPEAVLQPNVIPEVIGLLLFPFSVTGKAQTWINSLPINSITTWEELVKQFLNKFYPTNKTVKQVDEILIFRQKPTEILQETWERFKGMPVKYPHHGIPDQIFGQRFYMELADSLKANVDASAGGAFLSKSFRECKALLDKMAQNLGWMTRDSRITHVVHSVVLDPNNSMAENMTMMMTQLTILTKKIDESGLKQGQAVPYQRQQGYNQQNPQLAYQQPQQQRIVRQDDGLFEIKGMLQQLIGSSEKMEEKVNQMQEKVVSHDSAIKGIEIQLGQISMALNNRPQGTLLADTHVNPKEQGMKQLMDVSLRNSRDLDLEQEIARKSRPTKILVPVPIEVDESTELTKVRILPAQEEINKETEVEKEVEGVMTQKVI